MYVREGSGSQSSSEMAGGPATGAVIERLMQWPNEMLGWERFRSLLHQVPEVVWSVAAGLSMRIASRPIALSVNERPERPLVIQSRGLGSLRMWVCALRKPGAWHPVSLFGSLGT